MPTSDGTTIRLEVWDPAVFDPQPQDGKKLYRKDGPPLATAYQKPKVDDKPEILMEEYFDDEVYQTTNYDGPVEHHMVKSGKGYFAPGYRRPTWEETLGDLLAAREKLQDEREAVAGELEQGQGEENGGASSSSVLPSFLPSRPELKTRKRSLPRRRPDVFRFPWEGLKSAEEPNSAVKDPTVEAAQAKQNLPIPKALPNEKPRKQQQNLPVPKALRVLLTFTSEPFDPTKLIAIHRSMGISYSPSPDLCVNVFYNGEFVHSRVVNNRYKPKVDTYSARSFSGRPFGNKVEVPFILQPPIDKDLENESKITETNAQRWRTIALSLNSEADEWREGPDNGSLMRRSLRFIARLKMPDEMKQTSGARKFGVIDVIVTAGTSMINVIPTAGVSTTSAVGACVFGPTRILSTGIIGMHRVMCSASKPKEGSVSKKPPNNSTPQASRSSQRGHSTDTQVGKETGSGVPGQEAKQLGSAEPIQQASTEIGKRKTRSQDAADSSKQPDDETPPPAKKLRLVLTYRKSAVNKKALPPAKNAVAQDSKQTGALESESEGTLSSETPDRSTRVSESSSFSTRSDLPTQKADSSEVTPSKTKTSDLQPDTSKEPWVPPPLNNDSVLTYGSEVYNRSNYSLVQPGVGDKFALRKGALMERETLFDTKRLIMAVRFVCPG